MRFQATSTFSVQTPPPPPRKVEKFVLIFLFPCRSTLSWRSMASPSYQTRMKVTRATRTGANLSRRVENPRRKRWRWVLHPPARKFCPKTGNLVLRVEVRRVRRKVQQVTQQPSLPRLEELRFWCNCRIWTKNESGKKKTRVPCCLQEKLEEERLLTLDGFLSYVVDKAKQDVRAVWRGLMSCGFDLHYDRWSTCLKSSFGEHKERNWDTNTQCQTQKNSQSLKGLAKQQNKESASQETSSSGMSCKVQLQNKLEKHPLNSCLHYFRCCCIDTSQAHEMSSQWTPDMDAALALYTNRLCQHLSVSPARLHPHEIYLSEAESTSIEYSSLQGSCCAVSCARGNS